MFANRSARIFGFMDERAAIVTEVCERVVAARVEAAERSSAQRLAYVLNEAAYSEMQRLSKGSSKMDIWPYEWWQTLARSVGRAESSERRRYLREIAHAYSEDVAGQFTPAVYRFATSVLPVGLSALFNAQHLPRSVDDLAGASVLSRFRKLSERIVVEGQIAHLRQLAEIGTLIVVPTHSSNLDSIAVGWALEESGLPPVTYGAGKNLFTSPLTSFFMHNLGAYKVDRRIQHTIYKDVLKTYSQVLLERGYHSLFFPGGTRSRSNVVETRLKLGLLGTALSAYTRNLQQRRSRPKIFICPLTINYHLVLEAETLIAEHLRRDGGARYIIDDDEFADISQVLSFAMKTMGMEYTVYLRFGEPIDPFGNPVDVAGISRDPHERPIDIERYLWTDGQVRADFARDREYTLECGDALGRAFKSNTVVLSSTFAAFVAWNALQDAYPDLDLYRLLRVGRDDVLSRESLLQRGERLRDKLKALARKRRVCLSHDVERLPIGELLDHGASVLGMFHARPAVRPADGGLCVSHPELLLFYANRLAGYGLESVVRDGGLVGAGSAS